MRVSTFYMGVVVPSMVMLPIVVAVIKMEYWKAPERLSFFYLIASGIFNVVAKLTASFHINNLPFLHLYTVIEFCLLCAFFRSLFIDRSTRLLLGWLMIVFPVIAVVYIIITDSLFTYNVLPRFLSSIILLAFCIRFLISNLNAREYKNPFSTIVVIALLLYFSSSSIFFALIEFVRKSKGLVFLWNVHATFVLIMYLIFTVAYLKINRD